MDKEKQITQEEQAQDQSSDEQKYDAANKKHESEQAACIAELAIWKDQCKRISAEFENFKKRAERDQARWSELAKESILYELLSFVDTFDLALQQKNGTDCQGIEMAYQSLMKLLQKHDVVVMKNFEIFDPKYHEAVMQVQSDKPANSVVEVLSKGFTIKDRVLRPAKVSVAV